MFRYPGGKSKLSHILVSTLNEIKTKKDLKEYREPFFGGGSIGLKVIDSFDGSILNDKDIGLFSLWLAIKNFPNSLVDKIRNYKPTVEDFYSFKEELLSIVEISTDEEEIVSVGFKKLVIHQISYSGLGTMSGGPLGGKQQSSKYKIDCRWSPDYIVKKLRKINKLFNTHNVEITCDDYSQIITNNNNNCLLYLDPPYYEKGGELYQHAFNHQQHLDLSNLLKETNHYWVLTYDNCEEIKELYNGWAKVSEITVNYSIKGSYKKSELIITNI